MATDLVPDDPGQRISSHLADEFVPISGCLHARVGRHDDLRSDANHSQYSGCWTRVSRVRRSNASVRTWNDASTDMRSLVRSHHFITHDWKGDEVLKAALFLPCTWYFTVTLLRKVHWNSVSDFIWNKRGRGRQQKHAINSRYCNSFPLPPH